MRWGLRFTNAESLWKDQDTKHCHFKNHPVTGWTARHWTFGWNPFLTVFIEPSRIPAYEEEKEADAPNQKGDIFMRGAKKVQATSTPGKSSIPHNSQPATSQYITLSSGARGERRFVKVLSYAALRHFKGLAPKEVQVDHGPCLPLLIEYNAVQEKFPLFLNETQQPTTLFNYSFSPLSKSLV